MNYINAVLLLFNLNVQTLIGTLVWGNLAAGIIIYLYEYTSEYKFNFQSAIYNMATIRFISALGYLCLFLREAIPNIVSVNIGNTVLYLCYYLESCMLLKITNLYSKKIHIVEAIITVLSIVIFNLLEFLYGNASVRIGTASIAIFLLLLYPAVLLLTAKQAGKFKKGAGIFYIPLLLALIPRGVEAFIGRITDIRTNTYYQTLLFGSLGLLMISNTIIYLLFVKEKSDSLIEKMANYDNLTDVMNRHNFFSVGKTFFEKSKQYGNSLSVLFLDLDFFKTVNDRFGHQFGDKVLIQFADTIKKNIRPADICCRYGGEEFVVLANVNKEGCQHIANRILQETEKITFDDMPEFHITTSIGCTTGIPKLDETLEYLIDKADKALYKAKNEGRNRIVNSGD